jgi:hypothetical protein
MSGKSGLSRFTDYQLSSATTCGMSDEHTPTLQQIAADRDWWPERAGAHYCELALRRDRKRMMVQADVFSLVLTCGVIGLILSRSPLSAEGDPSAYVLALSGLAFLLGSAGVIRDKSCREGGYGPR